MKVQEQGSQVPSLRVRVCGCVRVCAGLSHSWEVPWLDVTGLFWLRTQQDQAGFVARCYLLIFH